MNFFERVQLSMAKRQLRARRAEFYFDLAMSLEDRIPLFSTFKKYEKRARKRDRGMALLYRHILKNSINGSLATALEGVAPSSELMMLDAAQTAGDASVAEGLRFLSTTVEKTERMTAAIKGAVLYPLFLIALFYAILLGFSFYAIPVLESIMPVDDWPASGKALAFVANGVRHYGLIMIVANVILFIAFMYSLAHWAGTSRRPFDKRLPYSVYRDYAGAMLIVSLASLMRSGISLRSSLEQAVRYSTPWMRWHLRSILRGISSANAENFGAAFGTGVLNQDLEDRIMDASERRDPVEAFVKIGTGSIDRIATSIEKSSARLNSVMLLACGVALATMLLGFTSGNADVLRFGSGINSDQLWFRHVGNNLEISVIGTADKTIIENWYVSSAYQIERISTADNLTMANKDVERLVQAMSGFDAAPPGTTVLPPSQRTALAPVLAASWH